MKMIYFILVSLLTVSAYASSSDGVPTDFIFKQAFNFILIIGLLVYLLRNKVKEHFHSKHEKYNEFLVRAEKAKMEAENSHKELLKKINELESSKEATLKKAHSEAAELKRKTLEEAKALTEKLEHDARVTAENEIERAKELLRGQMLTEAIETAQKALSEQVKEDDLKRLQTEFVERIQVVK